MKKNFSALAIFAGFSMFSGFANAFDPSTYTAPANKVGGAVASGIQQSLVRRGFAIHDPRVYQTIMAIGNRVPALAAAAGTGANWIGMVGRLSPWITVGVLVYQGISWYIDSSGNVTARTDAAGVPTSGGTTVGGACYLVLGGSYCGSTPEEALLTHILSSTVYTDLTTINLSPEPLGSSAYNAGRRYTSTIAGHRNNEPNTIWPSASTYYIHTGTAQVTCPGGFVANGPLCVPNQLGKYIPQPGTGTAVLPQTAYNNLPQSAKDAALSPELAADTANRIWRDAASQPDYRGVPWSSNDPVLAPDFNPHKTNHPADWPKTSDLNSPVPTSPTPITSPETNPNLITPPASATKIDLGPDPGTVAPTLEEPPSELFKPIQDLLQPWTSWEVPSHSGQCPTWQASPSISGHVFAIDLSYHCTFAEQYRSMILAASLACWILMAAFIILSA